MFIDQQADPAGQVGSSLMHSVDNLYVAAAQGSFWITPEGGQAMVDVIDLFLQDMDKHELKLESIQHRPPLGQLEGGKVMSPFMLTVATDENSGFTRRFGELKAVLAKTQEALKQAMINYQQHDAENADRFRRQVGERK